MSTERANDRLITVHAPFLAIAPNQNATLQFVLCTIDPQCEDDCCRLCGFVLLEKKRKRNIVCEFAKMFETMVRVEILEGSKRAVRDTCRYSSVLVKFHGEHLPEFFISSQ